MPRAQQRETRKEMPIAQPKAERQKMVQPKAKRQKNVIAEGGAAQQSPGYSEAPLVEKLPVKADVRMGDSTLFLAPAAQRSPTRTSCGGIEVRATIPLWHSRPRLCSMEERPFRAVKKVL